MAAPMKVKLSIATALNPSLHSKHFDAIVSHDLLVTAVGRAALIVQPAPLTVDRAQVNAGAVACAADLLYGDLPVTRRLVTDIAAVGYAWVDSDDGFY